MIVLIIIVAALFAYGAWEYLGHQRRLAAIPIRIHVNGSRGKSSVTRLIAAGLREGGIRTVAKTTGTLPRLIDPNGNEIAILRTQRANIIEQVSILRYVERYKPQALVMECMAVLPEYQWICERQMVRSTLGVITNSRLDHINEMGRWREQIARSLANTCPTNGTLFTSEKTNFQALQEIAGKNRSEIFRIGGQGISNGDLKGFGHIEHPANVGLALAVCEKAGVDRRTALKGMWKSTPDAGALRIALCLEDEKELMFVNALAANDPESSLEIWEQINERYGPLGGVIVMLNSRADRQDRSIQLIEMVVSNIEFDKVVLTGEKTQRFLLSLQAHGIPKSKILALGREWPEKVYHQLFDLIQDKGMIFAIGNVGAGGLDIFKYFYKRRTFPVGLHCPQCQAALQDAEVEIDGLPSVLVDMELEGMRGWLRLSSLYGSFRIQTEFSLEAGQIVRMFCPYCKAEFLSDEKCPECGITMVSMSIPDRGIAHLCPKRGCKGHVLDLH